MLDVQAIRKDFPILDHKIYDKPLIYFDNGATTQKPRQVVERIESGYYNVNANIHRGVHFLSQAATEAHEEAQDGTAFLECPLLKRDNLYPGYYGIDQSGSVQLYGRADVGGRRGDRLRDGASFQYRSLADTGGPEGDYAEGDPDE